MHMREPRLLFGELGGTGMVAFQLIVGGNALVPLLHPVFMFGVIWEVSTFALESDGLAAFARLMHYLGAATVGYLTSAYVSWHGLSHRGVPNKIRILLYRALHWLLLSAAARLAALAALGTLSLEKNGTWTWSALSLA